MGPLRTNKHPAQCRVLVLTDHDIAAYVDAPTVVLKIKQSGLLPSGKPCIRRGVIDFTAANIIIDRRSHKTIRKCVGNERATPMVPVGDKTRVGTQHPVNVVRHHMNATAIDSHRRGRNVAISGRLRSRQYCLISSQLMPLWQCGGVFDHGNPKIQNTVGGRFKSAYIGVEYERQTATWLDNNVMRPSRMGLKERTVAPIQSLVVG